MTNGRKCDIRINTKKEKRRRSHERTGNHCKSGQGRGADGIDRQADELYETMYAKLSNDERYKRTGSFMEDYRRQTEIQRLIEEEILFELVYVD